MLATLPPLHAPPPAELSYSTLTSSPSTVQVKAKHQKSHKPIIGLRPATADDAQAIASLGAFVFATTFGFSIPPRDLAAYLNEAYSIPAIERDILNSTKHLIVACDASTHQVIGFAQLTEGTTEPCLDGLNQVVELQRLYVDTDYQGFGIGKTLTHEAENIARDKGYQIMWLGVWEGNFQAQRIYEAMGFTRHGDHEFEMGRCIQTDWIMCKDL